MYYVTWLHKYMWIPYVSMYISGFLFLYTLTIKIFMTLFHTYMWHHFNWTFQNSKSCHKNIVYLKIYAYKLLHAPTGTHPSLGQDMKNIDLGGYLAEGIVRGFLPELPYHILVLIEGQTWFLFLQFGKFCFFKSLYVYMLRNNFIEHQSNEFLISCRHNDSSAKCKQTLMVNH